MVIGDLWAWEVSALLERYASTNMKEIKMGSEFGAGGLNQGAAFFQHGKMLAILSLLGCDIAEAYVRKDLTDPTLFRWYVRTVDPAPTYVPGIFAQAQQVRAFITP